MEVNRIQCTTFTGCRPPYKISGGSVYPINRIADEKDIVEISGRASKAILGEGKSGIVYDLCSNVLKFFKETAFPAPIAIRWKAETENLDLLRDLCLRHNNPDYLHDTQKGLFGINFRNEYFIFSSKVPGSWPHPQRNQFNEKNLTALMEILERLDKGMDNISILHPDLRGKNVHITNDNAGILDVGILFKEKLPKEKFVWDGAEIRDQKSFTRMNFLSDTGYGTSNIKAFEYDLLGPYLDYADKNETNKTFDLYMGLKAKYFTNMYEHNLQKYDKTGNKIIQERAGEESCHAELLRKLPKDIKETEIDKLQIGIFFRKLMQISNNSVNNSINLKHICSYIDKSIDKIIEKAQKACMQKDLERAVYYINAKNQTEIISELFRSSLAEKTIPYEKLNKMLPEKLLIEKVNLE